VNEAVNDLRSLIQTNHNGGPERSFLKFNLADYEECVPVPDVKKLEEMLESDLNAIKKSAEDSKRAVT